MVEMEGITIIVTPNNNRIAMLGPAPILLILPTFFVPFIWYFPIDSNNNARLH
jgi:hypothetical protein